MRADIEWQQELLYQRFATWEPKHTVPTYDEHLVLEHQRKLAAVWMAKLRKDVDKPSFFATFSVDHWNPPTPESGEDKPQ